MIFYKKEVLFDVELKAGFEVQFFTLMFSVFQSKLQKNLTFFRSFGFAC
jgi:hypothetical protein